MSLKKNRFNRTFMELKHYNNQRPPQTPTRFNRTFMELKQKQNQWNIEQWNGLIGPSWIETSCASSCATMSDVLIGPSWN